MNGLQCLIEHFALYMSDLQLNLKKTFVMTCRSNRLKNRQHHVGGAAINRVSTFSYLGSIFNRSGTWNTHIESCNLKCLRTTERIFRFSSKIGNKPIREILALYRSKCVTGVCYGAAIWGRANTTALQIQENKFRKRVLAVSSTTANYIVHKELSVPYLSDLINMAGLPFWQGIRAKDETKFTKDLIMDCLALDHSRKIPWLEHIHTLLTCYKVDFNKNIPVHIQDYIKSDLKLRYMNVRECVREAEVSQKHSVLSYCECPSVRGTQTCLTLVRNTQHRFYLTRLRFGILHYIIAFPKMEKWCHKLPNCPCDGKSPNLHCILYFFVVLIGIFENQF